MIFGIHFSRLHKTKTRHGFFHMNIIYRHAKSQMYIHICGRYLGSKIYIFFIFWSDTFTLCSLTNIQFISLVRPIYWLFNNIHCLIMACIFPSAAECS